MLHMCRGFWEYAQCVTCSCYFIWVNEMKWHEWGLRPHLCTYRLNWARRTSWGCWDEWNDTALQTQDSIFEHWRSEAERATSRSRRFPTILNVYEGAGIKTFCFFDTLRPEWGSKPRSATFQTDSFNHCNRDPAYFIWESIGHGSWQ